MELIDWLKSQFLFGDYGRIFGGVARSPKWESFKREYEKTHPKICAVTGSTEKVQLHHIKPYHTHPELELDPENVIWLSEGSGNFHLWLGHLGNFQSWNEDVIVDARIMHDKIKNRPHA